MLLGKRHDPALPINPARSGTTCALKADAVAVADHAAEQQARAALRLLGVVRPGLDRHAPGNLAHRRQEMQAFPLKAGGAL